MSKQTIYLDYAAATPLDERVLEAMQPYFTEKFYNPSATYLPAKAVKKDIEAARTQIAYWLGARPAEIIFTAGGTEANNLAIHGVMRQYSGSNIIISSVEHESVRAPASRYDCREVPVDELGIIQSDKLEKLIDDETVLISIIYAGNEIGTVQPIKKITAVIAEVRKIRLQKGVKRPLYLHTDAAQATNYLDLHAARLGVDLLSLNGGKIYGPKQSGALFVRAGVRMEPLIGGGGQEQNLRSGTENVPSIIGLAKALDLSQKNRHEETERLAKLQRLFFDLLEKIPITKINGSLKLRLPNNIHVTFAGTDNERLLIQLDEAGILAAAGSACSAASEEPSHVLRAIGLTAENARSSLRFTMGRSTTEDDIHRTVDTLARLHS
jgi:cysteine desulfurase